MATMKRFRRRSQLAEDQPSALSWRDLSTETLTGIVQRPGRSLLTILGTVLGVGAFVAVLGLTSTAASQIDGSFSTLQATTVTVRDARQPTDGGAAPSFLPDSDDRIQALNGVVAGGVWWPLPAHNPILGATPRSTPDASLSVNVYASSPGALSATEPTLQTGILYNRFHQSRAENVCVLGRSAAAQLGITRIDNQPVVFINNTAYSVVGILSDVHRLPEFLRGVIIPSSTALAQYGPPNDSPAQMVIHTRLGAAPLIARQAALALRPDLPELLAAVPPPDPHSLQDSVNTSLTGLFLMLAGICLVIGSVGIANTTLVAVLERTGEIGLRRSLGARPTHITMQFLSESTALGTIGGLVGTALGVATVVSVALVQHWTAVLNPLTALPAPLIGSFTGLLAGIYPALRASRIEPLDALRY